MYAIERHERIAELLQASGRVTVTELADSLAVTAETVRRDLDVLERQGALRRVHGGAVASGKTSLVESTVADRAGQARETKLAIARAAFALLGDEFRGSILLDAGTTTGALAELLADWRGDGSSSITVITNSVPIAALLHHNPALDLHLLGGSVRGVTSAAVGGSTIEQLAHLRPDIAFLGANGISAGFGLSTPEEREASVKSAMVRAARRTVALVDSSKLGDEALYRFAELRELDTLISDTDPIGDLSTALDADEVEVIVA
ncbi:MAG TPA: DeoR/GlpR family DNA-binding transcription regulator [Mycetocola sp.]|jgi:DeoR family fructose operon transcriptional repressor|uniref:DeoR/GlpR family DNA-binding transcription regulator n=1 Tax=Mycetocola sp. TaxID=1871042 RepID=UPI002634C5D3|nr:DeoR/GlpR family DNA-binding transcription regulator [Mycetocola sp.]MCU1561150.1 D-beta-D-heptose 1-phosphate adenosyltransferase [Mycetocola sp.]HEV7848184.1 DeoR/GlpR family DNA-binding transcription regulator [Mycetocola sp.]